MEKSIAVDGSDAHDLSIAETSSSDCFNEIEEKKPKFNTAQAGWKDVKIAIDTFNGFQREVRCYKLHYNNLLKKFQANDNKARWKSGSKESVTKLKVDLANLVALQRDADIENAATDEKIASFSSCFQGEATTRGQREKEGDRQKAMEIYSRKKADNYGSTHDDSSTERDSCSESSRKMKKKKVDIEAAILRKWKWESRLEERRIRLEESKLEIRRKELETREKKLAVGTNATQMLPRLDD
ncbi:hypothetical protein RvY_15513 [Ramazzottius varieornatus]|uniref:Uncharacterized protein n=1 Tax=Ramazzottius varieornatus TaxID=947166 RepID=A0A1D1VWR2_RAMVA|nr:hypothetical protein RvY_15513 [Ramazzottius varieornatus]